MYEFMFFFENRFKTKPQANKYFEKLNYLGEFSFFRKMPVLKLSRDGGINFSEMTYSPEFMFKVGFKSKPRRLSKFSQKVLIWLSLRFPPKPGSKLNLVSENKLPGGFISLSVFRFFQKIRF